MYQFLPILLAVLLSCWLSSAQSVESQAVNSTTTSVAVPSGFVTTNGTDFVLDGAPFAFIGANAYWLPLLTTDADVEATLSSMQQAGVKVLRTWGFNAINGSELEGAINSSLTYYQVWNSSQWTINDGPQGLQRLDNVIDKAEKFGIKVILTFTNNWVGYGGAELYINWIVGTNATHDVFFTNPKIISSFQSYVKTLVNRYKDSSTIFAWELMNEARCLGDLPAGPNCTASKPTLTTWYRQQSDFVRSLDPHHMITTGGEGQFNWSDPATFWSDGVLQSDYNFNGEAGEDFEQDLSLPNISFGTYHMYPQTWYPQLDFPGSNFTVEQWGLGWINDHASTAKKVGKPLILEEFGVDGLQNKSEIYPVWVNQAINTSHAIFPWQFGQLGLTEDGGNRLIKYSDALVDGASPNDATTFTVNNIGLAIYPNQTSVFQIFTNASKILASKAH